MKIIASTKKEKPASDILIDYFIAKNNYQKLMEIGYQDQQAYLIEADLTALKPHITDQISKGPFEQVFGQITKNMPGIPIGFSCVSNNITQIYFLDFEKNLASTVNIKKSDYFLYLSLCHAHSENISNNLDI